MSSKKHMDSKSIVDQLERVVQSQEFEKSPAMTKFIEYVVHEKLAGRGEGIKAYTVAVDALGKEASYDAQKDSYIRVLAGRLRQALAHYYETDGANDPVIIILPKGGYVPSFEDNPSKPEDNGTDEAESIEGIGVLGEQNVVEPLPVLDKEVGAAPPPPNGYTNSAWESRPFRTVVFILLTISAMGMGMLAYTLWPTAEQAPDALPRVFVAPLDHESTDDISTKLAHDLQEMLANELSAFKAIEVICSGLVHDHSGTEDHFFDAHQTRGMSYTLSGSVAREEARLRVQVMLTDCRTRQQIWGKRFDFMLNGNSLFDLEDRVVKGTVGVLGGSTGVIARHQELPSESEETVYTLNEAMALYNSTIESSVDLEEYEDRISVLKSAVTRFPDSSILHGMLAMMILDGYSLGALKNAEVLEEASLHVNRAIELDPQEPMGLYAEAVLLWMSGEYDLSAQSFHRLSIINPNDSFMIGISGWHLALLGDFERGLELIEKSIELNPYAPKTYHFAYYLDYLRRGKFEKALGVALRFDKSGLFWSPLLRTVALVHLGRLTEARIEYAKILKLQPDFALKPEFYVNQFVIPDDLRKIFQSALRKVGPQAP